MIKTKALKNPIYFLILFTILGNISFSQSNLDSSLVKVILKQSEKHQKKLKKQLFSGELSHPIMVEYKMDEFQIEKYLERKTNRDLSSATYISELLLAEKRYQVLVYKYYNKLLKLVDGDIKKELEESQTLWRMYRDAEQTVNTNLNPEALGFAQIPVERLAERHFDITKYRALEIVDYLARMHKKE